MSIRQNDNAGRGIKAEPGGGQTDLPDKLEDDAVVLVLLVLADDDDVPGDDVLLVIERELQNALVALEGRGRLFVRELDGDGG